MPHPLHIVDVFAQEKYTGNQLAVVSEAGDLDTEAMQRIAQEMNYSETTFITGSKPTADGYRVRIFTPATELPFAGHPTLGTASVIHRCVSEGEPETIVLDLDIGSIDVTIGPTAGEKQYWMEQNSPTFGPTVDRTRAAEILGLDVERLDPHYDPQIVSTGLQTLLVPLRSLEAVQEIQLGPIAFRTFVDEYETNAVFGFSSETVDERNDLHARMFFDANGIIEDPATGSSNGCLAAYLVHHDYFGHRSIDMTVEQGYEIDRPSTIGIRADGSHSERSVSVGGTVIPVARGELL